MKESEIREYIDNLEPLRHDPREEDEWQAHYQRVVDNPEMFSEQYVEWNRQQLKVTPRYRKRK